MKKQTALEFAKEFINDLKENKNTNSEFFFNKEILTTDKNLKVLKEELKKIGFELSQQEDKDLWTLKKIKGV